MKDEYGAAGEWYWQAKPKEFLREICPSVTCSTKNIQYGEAWDRTRARGLTATKSLSLNTLDEQTLLHFNFPTAQTYGIKQFFFWSDWQLTRISAFVFLPQVAD